VGNYLQDHVATGVSYFPLKRLLPQNRINIVKNSEFQGRSHSFTVNVTWGQVGFFSDAALLQFIENATGMRSMLCSK